MTPFWLVRANASLLVAGLLLEGLAYLVARGKVSPASAKRFAYGLLIAVLGFPFLSRTNFSFVSPRPTFQVWSASTMRLASAQGSVPVVSVAPLSASAPIAVLEYLAWLLVFGAICRFLWVAIDLIRLQFRLRESFCVRAFGNVRVLLSENFSVPFSLRLLRRSLVVLPTTALENSEGLRTIVRHELQHHRQGDTVWAWFVEGIRVLFAVNPAAWLFARRITEFQELACDQALIGRGAIGPQAYGRCLIQVAQTALSPRPIPACAAGMASSRQGAFLHRRITMLFENKNRPRPYWIGRVFAVVALSTMALTCVASGNWMRDRRISLDQARQWFPAGSSGFPLPLNGRVLKQLNRYLGTPDGREFVRESLLRKTNYDSLLKAKLKEYDVPSELLAVALVESGYKNRPANANPVGAAGLWQFMAATARNYNLRVDEQVDERLHVEKETDAAFRLLKALHLRFQDWGLALLGYNAGEEFVQRAIRKAGTRDIWKLLDAGLFNDSEYVERVIAGALILKNPATLE